MSCVSFIRGLGLWPHRKITDEEVARASTDNALIDNDRAFQQMHEAYDKVPETNKRLKETIKQATRVTSPFADLENLMHGEMKKRARQ